MTPTRIVIVGAGIGGLSAALALARPDRTITLVEKRAAFAPEGAGIQISPNASRLLLRFGLGAALARVASSPEGIAVRDLRSGRTLGSVTLGERASALYGAPYWVIARADLHACLLDAVRQRPGIRLRLGRSIDAIVPRADDAEVSFGTAEGASETVAADLLIGADGIRSRVRALVGDRREPESSGFVAFRASVEARPSDGGRGRLWLGPGRHVVAYPLSTGRFLNVVAVSRGRVDGDGWSRPADPGAVARLFAGSEPTLRSIADRVSHWSSWPLHDLPVQRLAFGRVALLGDAGHAALPFAAQGAAMAVEDAADLAARLDRHEDPLKAVAAYEHGRRPRLAAIQRLARRNAAAYHAVSPVNFVRDLVMARMGPEGMLTRYDWVYGHDAGRV